jgi:uncharacterized protein YegL
MISALRQDPHALESVYASIITFDSEANIIVPLTALDELQIPVVTTPQSGPTHLGLALETLTHQVKTEIRQSSDKRKGDWAPYLFIMTDGKPSDRQLFDQQCSIVRSIGFASIIGCVAGPKASKDDMELLCDHVVALDTMDSASFSSLFKWVSAAISSGNRSMGASRNAPLPPPPPEIQLIV